MANYLSMLTNHFNLPYLDLIYVEGSNNVKLGEGNDILSLTTLEGFWMMSYPVSQAFWEAVKGDNPSKFKDPNRPVEQVSWDDIRKVGGFLDKLNGTLGLQGKSPCFRLPSEAEWEYAARGGKFWEEGYAYAGSDYLPSVGHYNKNTEVEGSEPLGLKLPNALGLYDMSGNVWEWCEDDWHGDYSNAPTTGEAWVNSPNRGVYRVNRGGSWFSHRWSARVAARGRLGPDIRWFFQGCRLVFA